MKLARSNRSEPHVCQTFDQLGLVHLSLEAVENDKSTCVMEDSAVKEEEEEEEEEEDCACSMRGMQAASWG